MLTVSLNILNNQCFESLTNSSMMEAVMITTSVMKELNTSVVLSDEITFDKYFTILSQAVDRRCSVKKMFLEILQNSQENTCV